LETSSKTNYLEKENSARRQSNSKRQYKEPSTIWKTFRHQITSQIAWFQRTTILEILRDMISQDHWETRLSAALAILWVSFSQLRLEWSWSMAISAINLLYLLSLWCNATIWTKDVMEDGLFSMDTLLRKLD
jgi:hypothetical protein